MPLLIVVTDATVIKKLNISPTKKKTLDNKMLGLHAIELEPYSAN